MPSPVLHRLSLRRIAALLLGATIASAGSAFADTVAADGDLVSAGNQNVIDLGTVSPGAVLHASVGFSLVCSGLRHADPGQTVTMSVISDTVPLGGAVAATDATVGPVPPTWTDDTAGMIGCPDPAPVLAGTSPSDVTLTVPTTPGTDLAFTLTYGKTLSPAGVADASSITGTTAVTFLVTVTGNTPPALVLPPPSTVEGNTTGGAIAAYSVSATDAEDSPPPAPSCTPAVGAHLDLGVTTIDCSVTDSGGLTATGSFAITVVDTTPPSFVADPPALDVVTASPDGSAVAYATPAATDIVDAGPTVGCSPPSGGLFPVGTTTVVCTATDASGNRATVSFPVTVRLATVAWDPPIGEASSVAVNVGRTLPVKVRAWLDGLPVGSGDAALGVTDCGATGTGQPVVQLTFRPDVGRWSANLDTSGIAAGCHAVRLIADGAVLGSFVLDVIEAPRAAPATGPAEKR